MCRIVLNCFFLLFFYTVWQLWVILEPEDIFHPTSKISRNSHPHSTYRNIHLLVLKPNLKKFFKKKLIDSFQNTKYVWSIPLNGIFLSCYHPNDQIKSGIKRFKWNLNITFFVLFVYLLSPAGASVIINIIFPIIISIHWTYIAQHQQRTVIITFLAWWLKKKKAKFNSTFF